MAEFFKTLASSRERRLRLWNIQVQECEYSFVGTFGARERAFLARPSLDHREVRRLLGHTKLLAHTRIWILLSESVPV